MTDTLYRTWGGLALPVDAERVADDGTLTSLDPARDKFLALFTAAINGDYGAAWTAAGLDSDVFGASPVNATRPQRPTPQLLRELVTAFPALFVYRDSSARIPKRQSILKLSLTQQWRADYVLAPVDAADERRAIDILQAVVKTIALTCDLNRHSNYDGGAPVFTAAEFQSFGVTGADLGPAQFAGDRESPIYWAASIMIETVETVGYVEGTGGPPQQGLTILTGTGNSDGIIPNLVEGDSEQT